MNVDGLASKEDRPREIPEVVALCITSMKNHGRQSCGRTYTIHKPLCSYVETNRSKTIEAILASIMRLAGDLLKRSYPLEHLALSKATFQTLLSARRLNIFYSLRPLRTISIASGSSRCRIYALRRRSVCSYAIHGLWPSNSCPAHRELPAGSYLSTDQA